MVRKRAAAQKALSPVKSPISGANKQNNKRTRLESPENDIKEQHSSIEYQLSGNGINDQPNINGNASTDEGNMLIEKYLSEKYNELPDFNTLEKELSDKAKSFWTTVTSDYSDFTNWTCLLQTLTDTEDNLEASRVVYNCFLRYYPYCYGYWKKFADIEKKNGNPDKAKEIFQQGLNAIPVCIDLWVHYLNFTIQQCKGKENSHIEIRSLFDQAIEAAGMEFKSNKLWDAYIEWEKSLGNLKHVTEIYDKLIATPTQQYMKNWQKFKDHLEKNSLRDVLPTEEYSRIIQQIDEIPPGMAVDDDPAVMISETQGDEKKETAKTERLKRKVILDRESVFVEAAGEIKKRWKYEDAIKRPYFHVKPLEKTQLKNWKEYLDYEMREGGHRRICFLFERCLVACALYEECWEKYIDYVKQHDLDKTRSAYSRACNIHVLKKYNLHLSWATFEERMKNYELASKILFKIDKNFPGMILITQRRVGLARRMNHLEDIVDIYKKAIERSERIEDKIFYSIKFSNVLAKFRHKKSEARDVLWKALELGKKHKRLYLQLLELELHYGVVENEFVYKIFSAVEHDMNLKDNFKELFSLRKIEFYEDNVDDIDEILKVKEAYKIDHRKRENLKKLMASSSFDGPSKVETTDTVEGTSTLSSAAATSTRDSSNNQHTSWHQNAEATEGGYYENWSAYAAQYAAYNQQGIQKNQQ